MINVHNFIQILYDTSSYMTEYYGKYNMGPAKTRRSTRTAFASELGAQGPLKALVSYY